MLIGLIANVGTSGNQTDIRLVRELVESYISKPSCIILLTVTMESQSGSRHTEVIRR